MVWCFVPKGTCAFAFQGLSVARKLGGSFYSSCLVPPAGSLLEGKLFANAFDMGNRKSKLKASGEAGDVGERGRHTKPREPDYPELNYLEAEVTVRENEVTPPLDTQQDGLNLDDSKTDGEVLKLHTPTEKIDGVGKKSTPPKPARPNYFLSMQVSQFDHVLESIKKVQSCILEAHPSLKSAMVDPVTAHVTLMVMRLEEGEKWKEEGGIPVFKAEEVLQAIRMQMEETKEALPIEVRLKGIGNFKNKVVYLDIEGGHGRASLESLARKMSYEFNKEGIGNDGDSFTPHITIAKMTRVRKGRKLKKKHQKSKASTVDQDNDNGDHNDGSNEDEDNVKEEAKDDKKGKDAEKMPKKIPADSYAELKDMDIGTVILNEIQLCRMMGRKAGEYYHVESAVQLDQDGRLEDPL